MLVSLPEPATFRYAAAPLGVAVWDLTERISRILRGSRNLYKGGGGTSGLHDVTVDIKIIMTLTSTRNVLAVTLLCRVLFLACSLSMKVH